MKEIGTKFNKQEGLSVPIEAKFYPEKATLLLNIASDVVDLDIKKKEAEQLGLSPKKEFHLTIIGSDTGEEILHSFEGLNEEEKVSRMQKTRQLSESIEWKVVLKNEFFYIQKEYNETVPEKRQSIIQLAEVAGLVEFYKKLNLLLGQQLEVPMPHITLYTTSTREEKKLRGIGIYSKQQFEELNPKKI
ncbi:MAG: hypothetical protein NTX82_06390 [Candidatus Parcubacteria bacterium]|nr:hypothetical protein [Candidatus Parcubacteria bacterium]